MKKKCVLEGRVCRSDLNIDSLWGTWSFWLCIIWISQKLGNNMAEHKHTKNGQSRCHRQVAKYA